MAGQEQGLLVVISGPSGVGKTTIVHRVREAFDAVFSISATTRPKSEKEIDGTDYFFITEAEFQKKIDDDSFLEHAEVFGCHKYGTLRNQVDDVLRAGRVILLDIDVQGGMQIRDNMKESIRIFILPPSEEELLRRLEARGREDLDSIQRRFREAQQEIKLSKQSNAYEYFITNDNLKLAVEETVAIIKKSRNEAASSS
ncbi:MAG: guanylate kinase [Phycisphaerae bacterium]|jgi:guanylate kinase|nr:guanylate kinase [Phycisphaerae bacterium]MBT5365353.1 guanylate kinase [Phycisphaerae bacterium]MBT6270169.1 guanylate kinase [Phycisphaerae bacterium]MBT6283271.1 guanylate kinase [Phycisphaerae bacterium]